MRRAILLFIGAAAALALVWGCSDDDSRVVTPSKPSPRDSAFVESVFGPEIIMAGFETVPVSMALLAKITEKNGSGGIPPALKALQGDDSVIIKSIKSYVYTNGWHVIGFGARTYTPGRSDTVIFEGLDSIRIFENGIQVKYPDTSTVVEMLIERAHMVFQEVAGGNNGSINHTSTVSFVYSGGDTVATLDGRMQDTSFIRLDLDSSHCEIALRNDQTMTGLTITTVAEEGDCPIAGETAMRVKLAALCIGNGKPPVDTVEIKGIWNVNADVAGDHAVTITYSNGAGSWSRTTDCKGPDE
ncbi:MAG: hypothetical protein PHR28_10845 [candidate division Zixibacteria bacterium]|nr:hypothetical protein [candidate division Zixibacteria bacterium]